MARIKVLIADDHNLVRQGLQTFLSLDPDIEVVGGAANGLEAIEMAHQLEPDVILLDLMMPQFDGFAALEVLRSELPQIRVLVLTSVLEEKTIAQAVRAGAHGYLLKNMEAQELCRTIKAAVNGPFLLSPEAIQLLVTNTATPPPPVAKTESLTGREASVLRLLAAGKANKEIARDLGVSEGTVKTHVSIILAKLGLQSRTQAAIYANQVGSALTME